MFGWNPNQWLTDNVKNETIVGASIGTVAVGCIALLTAPIVVPVMIGVAGVIGAGAVVSTLSTTALASGVVAGGVIAGAVAGHNAGSKENLINGANILKGVHVIETNLNTKTPKPNSDPSRPESTTIWKELRTALFGKGHN